MIDQTLRLAHQKYESPFSTRYGSEEMRKLFSAQKKHTTWRQIWIALAEAEQQIGLPITDEQLEQMRGHVDTINFEQAEELEKVCKHDVMAHIQAYGIDCPLASPIIHLGATSCLITDNAELMQIRSGLQLIAKKTLKLMGILSQQALRYKNIATLSYTHFQPAQPTTVGKRFAMWLQDFWLDYKQITFCLDNLYFLGVKGATGTQASFLTLCNGDHAKVKFLEQTVAQKLGFTHIFPISGQTYSRKQDTIVLQILGGIAASCHKMCTDLRLLAHLQEMEEPFDEKQVGSSAMPHKRNPMECERVCSLARYVMSLVENPAYTSALQWLERTLDDSANRRLCIPEAFLGTDAILDSMMHISSHVKIYEQVIQRNLEKELPFLLTENMLMELVKKGEDRQKMHAKLKGHAHEASLQIKMGATENDLFTRIAGDATIPLNEEEIAQIIASHNIVGRAAEQVEEFIADHLG